MPIFESTAKQEKQREYNKKYFKTKKGQMVMKKAQLKYGKTVKAKERGMRARVKRRELFLEIKRQYSCEICGEKDPACLDFHHTDPNEKEGTIAVAAATWSFERLKKELTKCRPLCSNCHRKLHFYSEERNDSNV